jgi:hypothetical protein
MTMRNRRHEIIARLEACVQRFAESKLRFDR